ncbi:MAG: 4-(cytidine 5'-diphospho)-2-C-methyl-D-erythritol kinase [Desulfococcus sp. 4484_241]|nr:MAG: 4-(cytidine 5'-diphospho)-2-C-methyl-D-erythritol kinase [Desulfococcus sp. 4484_241]
MKVLSPAKINLFLHVTGKRKDGYHELFSLMCPVSVFDEITLEIKKKEGITTKCDHSDVPSDESNLAHRAAALFFETTGIKSGLSITIKKNIPVCAGLGGGSSNAASVLLHLNKHFKNPVSTKDLIRLGASIGADIPFFLYGKPAIATGIGDLLTPYSMIPNAPIVLVRPAISISTAKVYKSYNLTLTNNEKNSTVLSFTKESRLDFAKHLVNDLEKVTALIYPEIGEAKKELMRLGAIGALMSGSGPTVFGIFQDEITAKRAYTSIQGNGRQLFYARLLTGQ